MGKPLSDEHKKAISEALRKKYGVDIIQPERVKHIEGEIKKLKSNKIKQLVCICNSRHYCNNHNIMANGLRSKVNLIPVRKQNDRNKNNFI